MDLIKEIAGDKLVIMVTHNPELAEKYADRIVKFRTVKLFLTVILIVLKKRIKNLVLKRQV